VDVAKEKPVGKKMERAKGFEPKGSNLPAQRWADASLHFSTGYVKWPRGVNPKERRKTPKKLSGIVGKDHGNLARSLASLMFPPAPGIHPANSARQKRRRLRVAVAV
jgi:hypothetical protein